MHTLFHAKTHGAVGTPPLKGRLLALAVAALATSISPVARALTLGDITVTSRLGEPLRAFVPLTGIQGGEAECVGLVAGHSGGDGLPRLSQATLRLELRGTGARLRVTTRHPVNEPILMVRLAAGCSNETTRNYTLLLAPPATAGTPVSRVSPADETASWPEADVPEDEYAAGPSVTRRHRKAARQYKAARRARTAAGVGREVDRQGATRQATLDFGASASGAGGDELALRRKEAKLLVALDDQAAAERELMEKIARLEETVSAMRQQAREVAGAAPAMESAPLPVAAPEKSAEPAPPAVAKIATANEPAQSSDPSPYWPWILGIAGLAPFGVLWRRRRQKNAEDEEWAEETPQPRLARPISPAHRATPAERPTPLRQVASVVPNLRADEDRIDVAEHDSALEMAEVLLSFGRVRGAAQTLEEHIEANPKETVRPWLRLLELYREEGMRAEFEALARRLNQTFNVEMMAWSQKPRRRNPDSLERYPHIVARLVECWNTPACADYLDQLLHDNRNGKRAGFSAEVLEEILLLATIRDRNAGTQERAAAPDSQRSPATRRETPLATTATAAKQAASSPRSAPRPLIHLLARDGNRPPQHASGQNAAG